MSDVQKFTDGVEAFTAMLVSVSATIPIIGGFVTSAIMIWKSFRSEPIDLSALAGRIERQVAANDAYGQTEIARLRAILGV